jgi:hypothetical protein
MESNLQQAAKHRYEKLALAQSRKKRRLREDVSPEE